MSCASRVGKEHKSMYVVGWIVPSITWKVSALLRLRANTCILYVATDVISKGKIDSIYFRPSEVV